MNDCDIGTPKTPFSASSQEGLDLLEAFTSLRDVRLRQSLIVLAQALALGSVGPEVFDRLRPVDS